MSQTNQRDRFIETARELGCDEDEAAFDAQLAVLAQHKPKDEASPEPPPAKPAGGC